MKQPAPAVLTSEQYPDRPPDPRHTYHSTQTSSPCILQFTCPCPCARHCWPLLPPCTLPSGRGPHSPPCLCLHKNTLFEEVGIIVSRDIDLDLSEFLLPFGYPTVFLWGQLYTYLELQAEYWEIRLTCDQVNLCGIKSFGFLNRNTQLWNKNRVFKLKNHLDFQMKKPWIFIEGKHVFFKENNWVFKQKNTKFHTK